MSGRGLGAVPSARRAGASFSIALMALTLAACSADSPATPRVTVTAEPGPNATRPAPQESPTPDSTGASAGGSEIVDADMVDAEMVEHAGRNYLVVTLPLDEWDVRVDWEPGGTMLADVIEADPSVAVATNAGIFTPEVVPGGLLVSDGEEKVGLNLSEGGGNFHLMPNAVFAVRDDGTATVVNSTEYEPAGVVHATQSGPALVLDGDVHPEFREGSDNLALRSGVGVSPDGSSVALAMSWGVTNLWDFATLFRDELGMDDALYLDGQISDIWVTGMDEPGALSGPYAGVITARPAP
ncbi:phosphodiester glycosidase family protein [Demequina sp. SO4-13]|uniref:phosphodiester glycosidase family protein n=1 Tax=Demequina sp. SO4-13 TaxID=3401027 RepID=UPI003AF73992